MYQDRELFLMMIALPGLFAISLLAEGVVKRNRKQSGVLEFMLGTAFLGLAGFAYLIFFKR